MPQTIAPKVLSWASDLDRETTEQARKAAQLPFIVGHVALMPDAHLGKGATIGSVIPTAGAVIPSAVGVDIGCGVIASETELTASDLPDDLGPLLGDIEENVPAGVGQGHDHLSAAWDRFARKHDAYVCDLSPREAKKAGEQFGTLGSGNHFLEVCLDEREHVWLLLHSGSRGIGNQLAQRHINTAKGLMKQYFVHLEDPELAYFVEGTEEFDAYIRDLMWAQEYAYHNRDLMVSTALELLAERTKRPPFIEVQRINNHHNYTRKEHHKGKNIWVTRKGAISAREDELGVIPGSMGTRSYIIRGRGTLASWQSCAHGAGRRMSRRKARETFTVEDLEEAMDGKVWLKTKAGHLIDESPMAYKDVDQVMADQADLVEVVHTLHQVLNYKGT